MRPALIISLVAWATPAGAQLSGAIEGPGIKLGEGTVLHPGISLDTAYDSNVAYDDGIEDPTGSPFLRLNGHLDLATLPPQRMGESQASQALDFRLTTAFGLREYLSDNEEVKNLRSLELDAGFHATFNPRGAAYFKVYDQFVRLPQAGRAEGVANITIDRNKAGAELGFRPGGGMTTATVGYEFDAEFYEEDLLIGDPPTTPIDPDSHRHTVKGAGSWKFLPKTALTLDVAYGVQEKDNTIVDRDASDDVPAGPAYEDSTTLRSYVGLRGLVSPKVSATARIGYGRANYDQGEDFNHVIGDLQVAWRSGLQSRLALGYERGFSDSVTANFYSDHYLYASYEHLIAGRALFVLNPGVRFREYDTIRPQFLAVEEEAGREDTVGELNAGLTYQLLPWFLLGGAYQLEVDDTEWLNADGFPVSYVKHVVYFRIEAAY